MSEPGADGVVATELRQLLVRAREDFLEDILRILRTKSEPPYADGEDIAREPFDELVPGVGITRAAAGDELRVALSCRLDGNLSG